MDLNVSRHLPSEASSRDWDSTILHYLGLDHIGHLSGPQSPLVPEKLAEMGRAIEMVHKEISKKVTTRYMYDF